MPRGVRSTVSAIAAIGLLVLSCGGQATPARGIDWAALVDEYRPTRGRVSVDLPYRPIGQPSGIRQLQRDAARARLEQAIDRARRPQQLHDLAILDLLSGRTASAGALLSELITLDGATASYWNDLGVVYMARAEADGNDGRWLAYAYDAFLTAAAMDPAAAPPSFNLAMIAGQLGLPAPGQGITALLLRETNAGWRSELERVRAQTSVDPATDWTVLHDALHKASVAQDPGRIARFPQASRECVEDDLLGLWGRTLLALDRRAAAAQMTVIRQIAHQLAAHGRDPFLQETIAGLTDDTNPALAAAFVAFAEGRVQYEAGHYEKAAAQFTTADAAFSRRGSPFALRNRLELATTIYQLRDVPKARAIVVETIKSANPAYRALLARAEWMLGLTWMQSGEADAAVAAFERSFAGYARIGETENAAAVANTECDTLRILGERRRGWSALVTRVLPAVPGMRAPRRRYVALLNASLFASLDGLDRAALGFQNASLAAAYERGVPNTIVEALTRRAWLLVHGRDLKAARTDVRDARRQLQEISSAAALNYQGAWLDSVEGELMATTEPLPGLRMLADATVRLAVAEPAEVPRLMLARATIAATSDTAQAEHLLQDGISGFERRWLALARDASRTSYLDTGWELYRALARLYAGTYHQPRRALAALERGKGMALARLQGVPSATADVITDLQRVTPHDGATIYFEVGERSLLTWAITASDLRLYERRIDRASLARRIGAYRLLLESRRDSPETTRLSAALYIDLLAAPLAELRGSIRALAIVPDDVLNEVPFATLTQPATQHALIDDLEVMLAPSAKALVAASSRRATFAAVNSAASILAVGYSGGSSDGRLAPIPEAEREATDVAGYYRRATVLTNTSATAERVEASLVGADVFHFAGHGYANETFPERSFLLMSSSRLTGDGRTTPEQIAHWPLRRLRLAVLSGCRTASGGAVRGEGILGLIRPFLAAGVPSVVGAEWDVDDYAARRLLSAFHQRYAATGDAAESLRAAQLTLKSSGDARLTAPGVWGAFVTVSGFAPPPRVSPPPS